MKFNYQDLSAETNGEAGRRYFTPVGSFPSITTVLGKTQPPEKVHSLQRWRDSLGHDEADEFTRQAAAHGTAVHLLIERYLKGEKVSVPIDGNPVKESDLQSLNSLKFKLRNVNEIWGQEVALYSEFFKVAGRCDFVGVYNEKPSILDFKTSSRIKNRDEIEDYKLQLAFYAASHNEMYGTNINDGVILMATKSGLPIEFHFELEQFYDKLYERVQQFYSLSTPFQQ